MMDLPWLPSHASSVQRNKWSRCWPSVIDSLLL